MTTRELLTNGELQLVLLRPPLEEGSMANEEAQIQDPVEEAKGVETDQAQELVRETRGHGVN